MNHSLYLLSIFIHVMTAMFWIGSMLFMTIVLIPSLRSQNSPELTTRFITIVGRRYRLYGWTALAILTATGWINLYARGISHDMLADPVFWQGAFGRTLFWKLILYVAVIVLSIVHDAVIGPRYRRLLESENRQDSRVETYRMAASWIGRLTLLLSLGVALLAIMLVRGAPW